MELTREQALALLRQYNEEPFHLRHALTVEAVMNWFARELGYGEEAAFWAQAGLLHDLDFERYPEEHCVKVREIMEARGLDSGLRSLRRQPLSGDPGRRVSPLLQRLPYQG